MSKSFLSVLIVLFSMMLISCASLSASSFMKNKNKQYLNAGSIPPLKIPPGVASTSIQSYYPVPYRVYPKSAMDVSITPPGLME